MQGAAAKGDLQRAQQLGETVLQLSRRLDASGADYNSWYERVSGMVRGIEMPSTVMDDGTSMGDLADILLEQPGKIAHALFGIIAQLSYAQGSTPVYSPQPAPAPPPPDDGSGKSPISPELPYLRRIHEQLSELNDGIWRLVDGSDASVRAKTTGVLERIS